MNERELLERLITEVVSLQAEVMHLRNTVDTQKVIKRQWMSLKETCEYLNIARSTMQEKLAAGEFPWAVKRGKFWCFPIEKVKKYAGFQV